MSTTADLVARSGDLKRELVQYAQQPRYRRALREAMGAQDLPSTVSDEQQWIMFLDYFVLQHRLHNGKTVVEQFVAARPDLPEDERDLLLGWRDVVEGIFEVKGRDGDTLVVENLIDDLTYRVRSNMGTGRVSPDAAPLVHHHPARAHRRGLADQRHDERSARQPA